MSSGRRQDQGQLDFREVSSMNEEAFNLSVRKFLKTFGLNGQHEIEQAVARALARGAIAGTESFPVKATLEINGLELHVELKGEIVLA